MHKSHYITVMTAADTENRLIDGETTPDSTNLHHHYH